MTKRLLFLSILFFCALILNAQDKPNIVFILADDLGWGDLKCYGHPYAKTPSRTGFMTSRHPPSYPDYPAEYGFGDKMTVTELLRQNGYTVGHFGKWHIGADTKKDPVQDGTYGIDEIEVIGGNNTSEGGRDTDLFEEATRFIEKNKFKP